MSLKIGMFVLLALFVIPVTAQAQECHPPVNPIELDGEFDAEVSIRLGELYRADQAARQPGADIDVPQLIADDQARREEVIQFIQAGQIAYASDWFYAALIFQHGDCPDDYQLAATLALRAHDLGYSSAGWLVAAATDRYLLHTGIVQRYGTQYVTDAQGHFALCPVDITTTDDERATWGLPSLETLHARSREFDGQFEIEPHPLAALADLPVIGHLVNKTVILMHCFA